MPANNYVTGRDLLHNKFSITVHKSILERFLTAIRQRQVVLSQYGIPSDILSLLANTVTVRNSSEANADATFDLECLAYCFYHFVIHKIWDEKNAARLFSVSKQTTRITKKIDCVFIKVNLLSV